MAAITKDALEGARAALLAKRDETIAGLNKIQGAIEVVEAQLNQWDVPTDKKKK